MSDFTAIMTKAGAVANISGQSFRDIAMSAALVSTNFTGGAEEATALRNALVKLLDPKTATKVGAALGIAVTDVTGKMKRLPDLLMEMEVATRTKGVGALSSIFGPKGGAVLLGGGLNTLRNGLQINGEEARKGSAIFERFGQVLDDAGGSVDKKFNVSTDNLGDQLLKLKAAAIALADTFLGPFVRGITTAVSFVTSLARGIKDLAQDFPFLTRIIGGIATIGGVLLGFGGAALFFFGGVALVRFGLKFLSNALQDLPGLHNKAAGAAGEHAIALKALGVTAGDTAKSLKIGGVTGGAKGMLAGVAGRTGLVGLVLSALGGAVMYVFDKLQSDKLAIAKAQADRMKETEAQNAQENSPLAQAADAFSKAAVQFEKLVDKFEGGIIKEFPFVSDKIATIAQTTLNNLSKTPLGALPAESVQMLMANLKGGLQGIKEGTSTPEDTENLVRVIQVIGNYARLEQRVGVGGSKNAAEFLVDAAKNLRESKSPEVAAQTITDKNLRTMGPMMARTDPKALSQLLLPEAPMKRVTVQAGARARAEGAALDKENRTVVDLMRAQNANMEMVHVKRMDFQGPVEFRLDGDLLRGSLKIGDSRTAAENFGGGR